MWRRPTSKQSCRQGRQHNAVRKQLESSVGKLSTRHTMCNSTACACTNIDTAGSMGLPERSVPALRSCGLQSAAARGDSPGQPPGLHRQREHRAGAAGHRQEAGQGPGRAVLPETSIALLSALQTDGTGSPTLLPPSHAPQRMAHMSLICACTRPLFFFQLTTSTLSAPREAGGQDRGQDSGAGRQSSE